MSDPIFERYKEALKAGHVAVLRGRLDDALVHYRRAAAIADERALPHSSMGGVLLRLGRIDDALAAYSRALARAPADEVALAGQAEALAGAGRSREAADTLELIAETQQASGRAEEALEALRRALALNETERRRGHLHAVERLVQEQREAAGAEAAAGARAGTAGLAAEEEAAAWPGEDSVPWEGAPALPAARPVERSAVPHDVIPVDLDSQAPDEAAGGVAAEAAALPALDAEDLVASADALAEGDETAAAVAAYVQAAEAYLAVDAVDAASDACQRALALSPGSAEVQLMLVRLYLARGARERAVEKLLLLHRLLELDGDEAELERVAAAGREAFPGDSRFEY